MRAQRREGKRKEKEGGGLHKLRLRPRIISYSFFTAPHAEDREREREGETQGGPHEEEEGEEEGAQRNDHGSIHSVSA